MHRRIHIALDLYCIAIDGLRGAVVAFLVLAVSDGVACALHIPFSFEHKYLLNSFLVGTGYLIGCWYAFRQWRKAMHPVGQAYRILYPRQYDPF